MSDPTDRRSEIFSVILSSVKEFRGSRMRNRVFVFCLAVGLLAYPLNEIGATGVSATRHFDTAAAGSSVATVDPTQIPRPIIKFREGASGEVMILNSFQTVGRHAAVFDNTNPIFQGFQVDLALPDWIDWDTSTQRVSSFYNDVHGVKPKLIKTLRRPGDPPLTLPPSCAGIDSSTQTCVQFEGDFNPGEGINFAWKLTDSNGNSVLGPSTRSYTPNLLEAKPSPPKSLEGSAVLSGLQVDWAEPFSQGTSDITGYVVDAVIVSSPPSSSSLEVLGVVPAVVSESSPTAIEIYGTGFSESTIVSVGSNPLSNQSFVSPELIVGLVQPREHLATDSISARDETRSSTLADAIRYESLLQAPLPEITSRAGNIIELNVTWESDSAALHDPYYRIDYAFSRGGETILNGMPWDDPCVYNLRYPGATYCGNLLWPRVDTNRYTQADCATNCYGEISYPQQPIAQDVRWISMPWAGDVRVFKFCTVVTNLRTYQRTISQIVEYEWHADGTGRVIGIHDPHTYGLDNIPQLVTQSHENSNRSIPQPSDEFHGVVEAGVGSSNSLKVSSLRPNRLFAISVSATNSSGTGNPATIYIRTPPATRAPDAPTKLVVSKIKSNSFTLAWAAPAYNGGRNITNFSVEVSTDNGTNWRSVKPKASTSRSYTVPDAKPGTRHLVRIAATNAIGDSEYLTGEVTTPATVPNAPSSLVVSDPATSGLTLSWPEPTYDGGAAISDYKVEYAVGNSNKWTAITITSSTRSLDVTSLLSNQAYRFRVSAINNAGTGPVSKIVSGTTLVDLPQAPTNLTASKVTATGASLAWKAPTNTGGARITDYEVETSSDNGANWIKVTKKTSNSTSFALTGLDPVTTYLVRVSAVNVKDKGAAVTASFRTLALPPDAPTNLRSTDLTGTTATIAWDAPSSDGGSEITNYRVEVSSNCKNYTTVARTASTSLAQNVSNLKPGFKYCFRVSAINARGTSPSSTVLERTTVGNAPNAPTSLRVTAKATQVTLSWAAATVTEGGPVRDYLVQYSTDEVGPWISVTKPVSTSRSLTIRNLTRSTSYLFRVFAKNDSGESPASANLAVTTPAR
jgi:fibronectin type 3 domain-containing protein